MKPVGGTTNYDVNGCIETCTMPTCVCEESELPPQAPGTSCDDGNLATTGDVIQSDGCSCA